MYCHPFADEAASQHILRVNPNDRPRTCITYWLPFESLQMGRHRARLCRNEEQV
jgi:hypothetical protein